uniref:Uncharacterized protein n=1 Tax=Glossina palpalis gambiensis TaxID=67801 RepID=A0A1B0AUP5_9MUSC
MRPTLFTALNKNSLKGNNSSSFKAYLVFPPVCPISLPFEKSATIHLVLVLYKFSKITNFYRDIKTILRPRLANSFAAHLYTMRPVTSGLNGFTQREDCRTITATSFSFVRDIKTTLRPCLANSFAYSLPIPSVAPFCNLFAINGIGCNSEPDDILTIAPLPCFFISGISRRDIKVTAPTFILMISQITATSFSFVRDIKTTLRPCLANSFAYSLPIPSVAPLHPALALKKAYELRGIK